MKKVLLVMMMVGVSLCAKAQFFYGVSFDISILNSSSVPMNGAQATDLTTYWGEVSPMFGYQFHNKWQVGTRLNCSFEKRYYTLTDDPSTASTGSATSSGQAPKETRYVTSSMGWDVAPFGRYRLLAFGKDDWFQIWADLHAYFGMQYPIDVNEEGYVTTSFDQKMIYGVQVMPALGFRLTEKMTLFVNFAIASLAYSGSYTRYNNEEQFVNSLILFTGKVSGLATTLTSEGMYGIKIGMVKLL